MRKVVLIVGLVLFFLLVVGIVLDFGLLDRNIEVEEGQLDLSGYTYYEMKPLLLQGEWLFYPGMVPDPGNPGSAPNSMYVPGSWVGTPMPDGKMGSEGYGAYRVTVILPSPGFYGLLFGDVYTACKVYVNGLEIVETGTFAADGEKHVPRFRTTPAGFYSAGTRADILILVSNYTHPSGGLREAPVFGTTQDICRLFNLRSSLPLFFSGIMLIAALFILFFYSRANPDRGIVYLVLFGIAMALKTLATSTTLVYMFPILPAWLILKIEYIAIPFGFSMFLFYSRYAFRQVVSRLFLKIFAGGSAIYILIILVTPVQLFGRLFIWYSLFLGGGIVLWLLFVMIAWRRNNGVSLLIVTASLVLSVTAVVSLVYFFLNIPNLFTYDFTTLGITVFMLAHYYEYSKQFLSALELSRQTSRDLEKQVAERTRKLQELNRRLEIMATTDELTTLWNRNELFRRTKEETARYNRHLTSTSPCFSVLFMDLDNFKQFNDTISHEAGDMLLKQFAAYLKCHSRETDLLFRMGGDEFVMFLQRTNAAGALQVARNLLDGLEAFNREVRETLQNLPICSGLTEKADTLVLTCSIGVAVHKQGKIVIEQLIQQADAALLEAKSRGKNCSVLYSST